MWAYQCGTISSSCMGLCSIWLHYMHDYAPFLRHVELWGNSQ